MDAKVGYVAVESFDPSWGESWSSYVQWSKLHHLEEVVSLDCSLCPSIIPDLTEEEDWDCTIYQDVFYGIFGSLTDLQSRLNRSKQFLILAVIREPVEADIVEFQDPRFAFAGFDLMDESTRISALTNCGGFDLAFQASDLSECGLIRGLEKAYHVKELLRKHYPEEPHADCAVWALWKMRRTLDP